MIVETVIVCVTTITITGTWLGLRFARETIRQAGHNPDRAEAIAFVEACVRTNSEASKRALRAMLIARPEALPREARNRAIDWRDAFKNAGITLPPRVPLIVGTPLLPPPVEPTKEKPAPKARAVETTFGAALRAAREREGVTQKFIAEVCGRYHTKVGPWEHDELPVPQECYEKLLELFPWLKDVPPPRIARRRPEPVPKQKPKMTKEVAAKMVALPDALIDSATERPAVKQAGTAPSLAGLRCAVRALRIDAQIVITIGDVLTVVAIGDESWSCADPDGAVALARDALGERLKTMQAEIEAARASLGGGT